MRAWTLVLTLLSLCVTGPRAMARIPSVFSDAAKQSLFQYSKSRGLDLTRPDLELFGFSLERHSKMLRTTIFDTRKNQILRKPQYACRSDSELDCWETSPSSEIVYKRKAAPISARDLLQVLETAISQITSQGVTEDRLSLFKVWPGVRGVYARLGFDARAIEISFVCISATKCQRADSPFENEP